jgi:hypothetical protein
MNKSLDIGDYNLDDLFILFKIHERSITETTLKRAKKITMMTHPDKSGRGPEIFIFFSKAYNILYSIYKLSSGKKEAREDKYDDVLPKSVVNKLLDSENFNVLFNDMWETASKDKGTTGHGDWLSSNEDIGGNDAAAADKLRNQTRGRQIAIYKEPEAICSGDTGTALDGDTSATNSGKYEDIRKAYTETMVGVSHQDYNNRTKYNSVDELVRARKQNVEIGTDHQKKLDKMNYTSSQDTTRRMYELVKQDESNREFIDKAASHLLRLKH